MKPELVIRNWLMAWLRPEKVTEAGFAKRVPITRGKVFKSFIEQFITEERKNGKYELQFSEDEIQILERVVTKPIKFATGYPPNDKEAIKGVTVYFIEGGWQQVNSDIGAQYWDGKASTFMTITGTAVDSSMAEPSLVLQLMTSLLIAGRSHFTAHHLLDQIVNETIYASDESQSREFGFPMRHLTMSYNAHRYSVVTKRPYLAPKFSTEDDE